MDEITIETKGNETILRYKNCVSRTVVYCRVTDTLIDKWKKELIKY